MINKVVAVGFKGLNFSQELKQRNIIVGPNGIGKSAIGESIILAVNGHVPGAGKTNQAVMDAFAGNDKLFVKIGIDKNSFERRFVKNSKGKVSQKYRNGNGNVSKETFTSKFAVAGKPAIVDLQAFLDLSDQKKIDTVFDLFPPDGDIESLSDNIDKLKNKLNGLRSEMVASETLAQKLTADKAEIELPSGTLAEVTLEIERTTAEVKLARKNLFTAQQREADKNAKEKAEAEAAEKADREAKAKEAERELDKENNLEGQEKAEEHRPQLCGDPGYTARNSEVHQTIAIESTVPPSPKLSTIINPEPVRKNGVYLSKETIDLTESIKLIISAIDKAGCATCAARLIAKRELRKY